MPLELATGIIRVMIDRQALRADIRAVRAEIIKGLSGIRVKVDIDAAHFRRSGAAAGRAAGQAAAQAARQSFNQGMRGAGTGMAPYGGGGMTRTGAPIQSGPGQYLLGGGGPAGFLGGPAGRTFYAGGAGQARIGTGFGGRRQPLLGSTAFVPRGFLPAPSDFAPFAQPAGFGYGPGRIRGRAPSYGPGSRTSWWSTGAPPGFQGPMPWQSTFSPWATGAPPGFHGPMTASQWATGAPQGAFGPQPASQWHTGAPPGFHGPMTAAGGAGGMQGPPVPPGFRRGGGGRFGGGGGRGFFGNGPGGRFMGGAAFQLNPLMALSAHYGGAAGMAGAMTAMAGTAAIKNYAEFEDQMNWVKFLQREAGANPQQIGALEKQARHLGRTTMFSATEAASAQGVLSKRGFNASQVQTQMPNVMNLAAAGEMDIGAAAEAVAASMQQFNLEAKDTGMIVDVLAKASLESASDVSSLAHALSYVGPIAHQAGMSFQETVAAITLMEDGGLKASRAGTGLARVLAKLADPKTEKVFNSIGIDIKDANGAMRDMDAIVKDVHQSLKGMSPLERVGFATGVFRERGGLAMATLLSQMDEYRDRLKKIGEAEGTAARAQEERLKSLTNTWKNLKDAVGDAGIAIGDVFGPGLTWNIREATQGLNQIMAAFRWLKDNRTPPWEWVEGMRQEDLRRETEKNMPVKGSGAPVAGDVGPAPGVPNMPDRTFGRGFPAAGSGLGGTGRTRGRIWTSNLGRGALGFGRGIPIQSGKAPGVPKGDIGFVPLPGFEPVGRGWIGSRGPKPSGGVAGGALGFGRDFMESERRAGRTGKKGFEPQFLGLEELHRNVQLGVLDKKDKFAEETAKNTKDTADAVKGLAAKNLGGGVFQ